MFLKIRNTENNFAVVVEVDSKVAYAYLLQDDRIVADVWLFNLATENVKPEWSDPDKLPYVNPSEYVSTDHFDTSVAPNDIDVTWEKNECGLQRAILVVRSVVHAVLEEGTKPGWCRLARKPSPLAIPLSSENTISTDNSIREDV